MADLDKIISQFHIEGTVSEVKPFGSGLINDTYKVKTAEDAAPDYILQAVENGIDLFDCVLATRMARNGGLFTDDGVIAIKKAMYKFDHGPIQEGCQCTCCQKYSRGYMHHLIKCNEMLGGMLATEHNLQYLYDLMIRIRKAIAEDRFKEFKREYLDRFYKGKKK